MEQIRETWSNSESFASISLLLSTTYTAMTQTAKATNKVINLGDKLQLKPKKNKVIAAAKVTLHHLRQLRKVEKSSPFSGIELESAIQRLSISRHQYRKEVRAGLAQERDLRDLKLNDIVSHPFPIFRQFRAASQISAPNVQNLHFGTKIYSGDAVANGMFDSLNSLKAPCMESYMSLPAYQEAVDMHSHIIKLAKAGGKIPTISFPKGEKLLRQLKASVMDFFSITSLHFLNAGLEGIIHFTFLLNEVINHINSASMAELNTIWANILHKGGGKDVESDRSWRTISCCPILAKALDLYMVELYDMGWSAAQAPTQFQGSNSSHDLAALTITEATIQGQFCTRKPVYVFSAVAQADNVALRSLKALST